MMFPWMRGEPELIEIPGPAHAWLLTRMFAVIVGEAFRTTIPPPLPKLGGPKSGLPFCRVNPLRTDFDPSPETNATTEPTRFPSTIVTSGPSLLVTVTALPRKFTVSWYVPGQTRTVSPAVAAAIAVEMVEKAGVGALQSVAVPCPSASTTRVVWATAVPGANARVAIASAEHLPQCVRGGSFIVTPLRRRLPLLRVSRLPSPIRPSTPCVGD